MWAKESSTLEGTSLFVYELWLYNTVPSVDPKVHTFNSNYKFKRIIIPEKIYRELLSKCITKKFLRNSD